MHGILIWQHHSNAAHNADNFALISQWLTRLNGQTVELAQRLILPHGSTQELDWTPKRFDHTFTLHHPRIAGITVYWQQEEDEHEHNITVKQLDLDMARQSLYLYPQNQPTVVMKLCIPGIRYETINLDDPEMACTQVGDRSILLFRDPQQHLEIKLNLSRENVMKLRTRLP
ncbi:hypothetical protein [Spirulina major]|uniref:hypothetical protein n=1 Tax=Spirulina major TaxID=270636 RepID=UPI000933FBEB|nr:hypothetical protein [Spirulina major]